jgi:GNAT superfamily N-acetyltransferase
VAERMQLGGHVYPFTDKRSGDAGSSDFFIVRPLEARNNELISIASSMQRIQGDALVKQFKGVVSADNVAKDFDPNDRGALMQRVHRINPDYSLTGGYLSKQAENLVVAEAIKHDEDGEPLGTDMIGFGMVSETVPGSNHKLIVALKDIFVDPKMQNRGVGSAIVHSLLDDTPPSAELHAVSTFAELDSRVDGLMQNLGFTAILGVHGEIQEPDMKLTQMWFGREVRAEIYRHPSVALFRSSLTSSRPHLSYRVAFSPYDAPLERFITKDLDSQS